MLRYPQYLQASDFAVFIGSDIRPACGEFRSRFLQIPVIFVDQSAELFFRQQAPGPLNPPSLFLYTGIISE